MHNNGEQHAVTFVLVGLFALTILSVAVPVVGHVLLGLMGLGIVGLVVTGIALVWNTREKPLSDDEIRAHRRAQHRDVMSR